MFSDDYVSLKGGDQPGKGEHYQSLGQEHRDRSLPKGERGTSSESRGERSGLLAMLRNAVFIQGPGEVNSAMQNFLV